MNLNKNITRLLLPFLALSIAGCGSGNSQTAAAIGDDYAAIVPYETSDTRVKHIGLLPSYDMRFEVESGLMDLSKKYFSPSDVAYKTHAYLDYDELDATDGSRGLLGTLRDDNPNGLNPGSGEEFDTGNGTVIGGIILQDIYELDFYQNDQLKGISLALVVDDQIDYDGKTYKITEDKMKSYLEVTSSKLVHYIRERFNEVGNNVPILVAAYQVDNDSTSNYGGFMYSSYFSGNNVSHENMQQQWVLVPSREFSQQAPAFAASFQTFKEDMANVLVDNCYVTGKAKIDDGSCTKLSLTITAHAKTAGEILAVVQVAKESLDVFEETNCTYKVQVINNNDVYAIMSRDAHSSQVKVITLD